MFMLKLLFEYMGGKPSCSIYLSQNTTALALRSCKQISRTNKTRNHLLPSSDKTQGGLVCVKFTVSPVDVPL